MKGPFNVNQRFKNLRKIFISELTLLAFKNSNAFWMWNSTLFDFIWRIKSDGREGHFFVFVLKDPFDNWVYSSVYSMKLIPTSCQLPWQQHWFTEEFRSWTSSKRSSRSSWGGQAIGVRIHWLSIRFRTSLEWHPLTNPRPYYVASTHLEIEDDHWSPISCVICSAHRSGSHINIFFMEEVEFSLEYREFTL